jgi:hypothetical protein
LPHSNPWLTRFLWPPFLISTRPLHNGVTYENRSLPRRPLKPPLVRQPPNQQTLTPTPTPTPSTTPFVHRDRFSPPTLLCPLLSTRSSSSTCPPVRIGTELVFETGPPEDPPAYLPEASRSETTKNKHLPYLPIPRLRNT